MIKKRLTLEMGYVFLVIFLFLSMIIGVWVKQHSLVVIKKLINLRLVHWPVDIFIAIMSFKLIFPYVGSLLYELAT